MKDADAVYRTDVFPGLGWMITLEIWREIGGRWPQNYWDEWMRLPEVRAAPPPHVSPSALTRPQVNKGRSVLRPEICRARTFGEQGSSAGQFFNEFLSRIELSSRAVPWTGVDVSYLRCAAARNAQRAAVPTLRSQEGHVRRRVLRQGARVAAGAQRAGGGGAVQRRRAHHVGSCCARRQSWRR